MTPRYHNLVRLRILVQPSLPWQCICAISRWMDSNKLMLNGDKTEVMTVGTASRINQIDSDSNRILHFDIIFLNSVKYLGVRLDHTFISERISDKCLSSFLSLGQIGCIRAYLSEKPTCLVKSIIFSRLDFCNSITSDQLNRLLFTYPKLCCLANSQEKKTWSHNTLAHWASPATRGVLNPIQTCHFLPSAFWWYFATLFVFCPSYFPTRSFAPIIIWEITENSTDQPGICWWTLISLCCFCCLEFASKQHLQLFAMFPNSLKRHLKTHLFR